MEFGSSSYMRKVLKSKLTNYIRANNREKVDRLLSNSANLEVLRNERYFNPFVVAIKENKLQMFDIMLQHGLEFDRIEMIRDRSKSSLRKRHGKRKLDKLDSSSSDEKGSDITVDNTEAKPMKNGFYSNTLVEAIKRVNLEAVERLLRLNVNVNSTNYRQIPLQIAYNVYAAKRDKYFAEGRLDEDFSLYERSLSIFKLLVINKACPNIYNNKGYRLIHQIVLDKDLELLDFLINSCGQNELNVNALTYGKMQNALHLITENKRLQTKEKLSQEELNLKLARALIYAGCDLNHRDYVSHETPIFRAIAVNNFELAKYFVAEGVDMSARNMFGNDVLSRSIQLGRFRIARLLIAADSPIRVYSCIYRIPNADDLNRAAANDNPQQTIDNDYNNVDLDVSEVNSENFLQYSIAKYEEFLAYLQTYTQRPRSLLDLSRLCVRNQMQKPISRSINGLGPLPKQISDLLLLKDIDNRV